MHEAEEDGCWAEAPLPGCVAQGDTVEEVAANLHEAIEGWLGVKTPERDIAPSHQAIKLAL